MYKKYVKRLLDVVLSSVALMVLLLPMLILAIVIKTKLGSPVIFSQQRPGRHGKIFQLYKFRSMTNEKDSEGNLLPDDIRLTGFGKKLRSTSLDELPELWNILKGDMSIIGPRPLLVEYLELYNKEQTKRHNVRPGLTGLAQISGRNALSWEERFDLDIKYVENINFRLDICIFFATIKTVVRREGISSDDSATMEPFKGSDS